MSDSTTVQTTADITNRPRLERELSASELRVLGTLIEKSLTTPEQYPLTLNSLRVGCNQKTSRDPVSNYDERTCGIALKDLISLKLAKEIVPSERGALKYEHRFGQTLDLRAPAVAVLAILMLRGAQTTGELRQNCSRLHHFETLGHLEDVMERLRQRELVAMLERAPGQREERFIHLFGDRAQLLKLAAQRPESRSDEGSPRQSANSELREEITELRANYDALQARVEALEVQLKGLL
jgi:uncharacterized protein